MKELRKELMKEIKKHKRRSACIQKLRRKLYNEDKM